MKKILIISIAIISLIFIVPSCEVDNYPYPDSQFFGSIKDSIGGALVETDLINGSKIGVYEQGFETPVLQNWAIKNNGEFRNNLVYSGTYNIEFTSCNFFPYRLNGINISPGENKHDFLVVPFIRVKDCTITHDATNNKITASFKLEAGKSTVKLSKITLYSFTDIYVGEYIKFSVSKGEGNPSIIYDPAIIIDPEMNYSLTIDLDANASRFSVHRNYYFRVGALASQSGVGTVRTNYAPVVKIPL